MDNGPKDESAKLERAVNRLVKGRPSCREKDKIDLREHLRLQLYPGQHVLFRDVYEGTGSDAYLAKREIICHSPKRKQVDEAYDALDREQRKGVHVDYVEPPRRGGHRGR